MNKTNYVNLTAINLNKKYGGYERRLFDWCDPQHHTIIEMINGIVEYESDEPFINVITRASCFNSTSTLAILIRTAPNIYTMTPTENSKIKTNNNEIIGIHFETKDNKMILSDKIISFSVLIKIELVENGKNGHRNYFGKNG
jgi:hypothetical protein